MALGQLKLAVSANLHHVPRLDRRGCRGEDDRDFLEMAAHYGHITGVILDAFFLLEAGLMGLVDDDQAEIGIWQEQGRPRSDHDLSFAVGNGAPCTPALGRTKVRMPSYRLASEATRE